MSAIATAVVGGAVIGGIASSKAGKAAGKAAKTQAEAQIEAAQISADTQKEMYYQSREDQAPWRQAGETALGQLEDKVSAGPGQFDPQKDPGYQFGYQEFVEKPTLRSASATGRLRSGATQKALSRYSQDYASTKYDNYLSRYYQSLAPLQSLAGVGQTAAIETGRNAITTGRGVGTALATGVSGAGDARASGYINKANVFTGGAQNITNALMTGAYTSQSQKPPVPAPTNVIPTSTLYQNP